MVTKKKTKRRSKLKAAVAIVTLLVVAALVLLPPKPPQGITVIDFITEETTWVRNAFSEDATYSTAWASPDSAATAGTFGQAYYYSEDPEGYFYDIWRSALCFYTNIGSGATVVNMTLFVTASADASTVDFTIRIRQWNGSIPFGTSHWSSWGTTNYDNGTTTSSGWGSSGTKVLYISDLNLINKTGYTKIMLVSGEDLAQSAPTDYEYIQFGSGITQSWLRVTFYTGTGATDFYCHNQASTVYGTTGKRLWTAKGSSQTSTSVNTASDLTYELASTIYVEGWNGTDTKISNDQIANAYLYQGETPDNPTARVATWTLSSAIYIDQRDSLRVEIYHRISAGGYTLVDEFLTGALYATKLNATTWTFTYYMKRTYSAPTATGYFYYGDTTYPSGVADVGLTDSASNYRYPGWSYDDGYESGSNVDTANADVFVQSDTTPTGANYLSSMVRFPKIPFMPTEFSAATLKLYCYWDLFNEANCVVYAHDVADSSDFLASSHIINRTRTTNSTNWVETVTVGWKSIDVTNQVKEAMFNTSWAEGNAVTLLLIANTDSSKTVLAKSFDTSSTYEPYLVLTTVEYNPPVMSSGYFGQPGMNYTPNAYYSQNWCAFNVSVTDAENAVSLVWINWFNGSWYNVTCTDTAPYFTKNFTGLVNSTDYSFAVCFNDTLGNYACPINLTIASTALGEANKTAYFHPAFTLNATQPESYYILYLDYFSYTNVPNKKCGMHGQMVDGTVTDTRYFSHNPPNYAYSFGNCTTFIDTYVNDNMTITPFTLTDCYIHFWWMDANGEGTCGYRYWSFWSDSAFTAGDVSWDINGSSSKQNMTRAFEGCPYTSWYLEAGYVDLANTVINGSNWYGLEWIITSYMPAENPYWITSPAYPSFIILNPPSNSTLNGMDSDSDGLTDFAELYVNFTDPFNQVLVEGWNEVNARSVDIAKTFDQVNASLLIDYINWTVFEVVNSTGHEQGIMLSGIGYTSNYEIQAGDIFYVYCTDAEVYWFHTYP